MGFMDKGNSMDTQKMFRIYDCLDGECRIIGLDETISFVEKRLSEANAEEVITFMMKIAKASSHNGFPLIDDGYLNFYSISEISSLLYVIKGICHRFFKLNMIESSTITWKHAANIDSLIDRIHLDLVRINLDGGMET